MAPAPTPFPPRSSPSTHSISRGTWCYVLVLSFSLRGGRREGQPLREPLPWGSSEDGADTSWAVSPPPAHQDPPLAAVQLVPKHRNPQAGFGHTSLGPLGPLSPTNGYSPCLGHLQVGRFPPLGIALLLLWNSSAHMPIRPSVLVPIWLPGTASWLGAPTVNSINLSWQPVPCLCPTTYTPT